jgi:hypothetical protein
MKEKALPEFWWRFCFMPGSKEEGACPERGTSRREKLMAAKKETMEEEA